MLRRKKAMDRKSKDGLELSPPVKSMQDYPASEVFKSLFTVLIPLNFLAAAEIWTRAIKSAGARRAKEEAGNRHAASGLRRHETGGGISTLPDEFLVTYARGFRFTSRPSYLRPVPAGTQEMEGPSPSPELDRPETDTNLELASFRQSRKTLFQVIT
jgi:hypothetical protein